MSTAVPALRTDHELSTSDGVAIAQQRSPHVSDRWLAEVAAAARLLVQQRMAIDVLLPGHVKHHKMLACMATRAHRGKPFGTRLRTRRTSAAPFISGGGGNGGRLQLPMSQHWTGWKSGKNSVNRMYSYCNLGI